MRILDRVFMNDLLKGKLYELYDYVKSDNTLDLQIRDNVINIYYLGGSILKITKRGNSYINYFDSNYSKSKKFTTLSMLTTSLKASDWYSYFPIAKQAMDFYFTEHVKAEREFQQLVVRENNYSSIAKDTDYYIIDIEYNNHKNARFDIIAIKWESKAIERKLQKGTIPKLTIFEMKYGDGALSNKSGMYKHCSDYNKFIGDPNSVKDFKEEVFNLFIQKLELNLINGISSNSIAKLKKIGRFSDEIDFVFLLANHKPAKTKLEIEVKGLPCNDVRFATSSFMGYGLYENNIIDKNLFLKLLK